MDAFSIFLNKYKFSNIELTTVKIDKNKKYWDLCLKMENVLSIEEFVRLNNAIEEYFVIDAAKVLFNITYRNKPSDAELETYYNYLIKTSITDARFLSFTSNRFEINNNVIVIYLTRKTKDSVLFTEELKSTMNRFGFNIDIVLAKEETVDINALKEKNKEEAIIRQLEEMEKSRMIQDIPQEVIKADRRNYKKTLDNASQAISTVPTTQEEIDIYRKITHNMIYLYELGCTSSMH